MKTCRVLSIHFQLWNLFYSWSRSLCLDIFYNIWTPIFKARRGGRSILRSVGVSTCLTWLPRKSLPQDTGKGDFDSFFPKTYKPSLTAPSLPGSRRKKATTYTRRSRGSSLKRSSTRPMLGSWGLMLPGCTIAHYDIFTSCYIDVSKGLLEKAQGKPASQLVQKILLT